MMRCPWNSRRVARRARQAYKEAPAGRSITLWPSGKVTIEAPGFGYQSLYHGDRLYPLRVWTAEPEGERRPWTYELLRDIREAAIPHRRLPGV
jgi:hypothetical protein